VRWLGARLLTLVSDYPRTVLALKAALAAGVAWLLVQPLGGVADDYAYYAPLGAVVVMSTTVMTSVRTGLQAVAAIGVGAGLAAIVIQLPVPRLVGIVIVVGVGFALVNWRRLGTMSMWVPLAALFVLILGGDNPSYYVLGYFGLTAVGAAVGVAVNLALPQLPLGRTVQALAALQDELAHQLRSLADDLRSAEDLGTDSVRISSSVKPPAQKLEQLVAEVRDARRVNWRSGRWKHLANRREEQARALETIAYLVEEVGALLGRSNTQMLRGRTAVGDAIADALAATADMLEATDLTSGDAAAAAPAADAMRCVEHLREVTLRHAAIRDADDVVLVGASATVTLQRAVEAWE
jgi:uncharacterized membrane protein YgaE (UPF0421/DUF939 family)